MSTDILFDEQDNVSISELIDEKIDRKDTLNTSITSSDSKNCDNIYVICVNEIPKYYEKTLCKSIEKVQNLFDQLNTENNYFLEFVEDYENDDMLTYYILKRCDLYLLNYDTLEYVIKIYNVKKFN